jgi:hypothetical protein
VPTLARPPFVAVTSALVGVATAVISGTLALVSVSPPLLLVPPQDAATAMGAYVLLMYLSHTASCRPPPLSCLGHLPDGRAQLALQAAQRSGGGCSIDISRGACSPP